MDRALRRWGRHLLGWPSGSPNAGVLLALGGQMLNTLALAGWWLFGRLMAMPLGARCPLPARVLSALLSTPESWVSVSDTLFAWDPSSQSARHQSRLLQPLIHGCNHMCHLLWTDLFVTDWWSPSQPRLSSTWMLGRLQWTRGLTAEPTAILLVPPLPLAGAMTLSWWPCCPSPWASLDLYFLRSRCGGLAPLPLGFSHLFWSRCSVSLDSLSYWICRPWLFNPVPLAQHARLSPRTHCLGGASGAGLSALHGVLVRSVAVSHLDPTACWSPLPGTFLSACGCATLTEELPFRPPLLCSRDFFCPLDSVSLRRKIAQFSLPS